MKSFGPILLIDDSDEIREAFQTLLELEGFEVVAMASAREALSALETKTVEPGYIVLDLTMPDMDGREFLRQRAERGIALNVPIVVFSAHTQTAPLEGTVGWAKKPLDVENLIEVFQKARVSST